MPRNNDLEDLTIDDQVNRNLVNGFEAFDKRISLRLSSSRYQQLLRLSEADGRKITDEIRYILNQYIDSHLSE